MTTDREEQLNAAMRSASMDSIASSLTTMANTVDAESARRGGDVWLRAIAQSMRADAANLLANRLPRPEASR